MNLRPINKEDYDLILELDRKVYPTIHPVTKETLNRWYSQNPEFGMIYEENNKVKGVCIVIPLNLNGWRGLIAGDLAEADLNESTIFDNSRDKEIGIHIYHIEKLDQSLKNFHTICLDYMAKEIKKLKLENKSLRVGGFSGLCVTSAGISLFRNKLNCKESDYVCKEYIFEKDGEKQLFTLKSAEEISNLTEEGYTFVNRCQMLVTYPNEESVVWSFI